MKPRYIKRIIKEDFPPEIQEWIDTLLYPLNQNIEQFNDILDKNVTLNDNIIAAFKQLTITGCSMIKGDTVAGSNLIQNASYYQATIEGVNYGLQEGQSIQGVGLNSGTTVISVAGSNVGLSQNALYAQTGADFMVGGNFPLTFSHGLTVRPSVVLIVKVDDTSPLQALQTQAFSAQWDLDGNNVIVKAIPGLQAGRQYKVTFLIL